MNAQSYRVKNHPKTGAVANWTMILLVLSCLIGGLWYSQGPGAAERRAEFAANAKAEAIANVEAAKARILARQVNGK